jgi:hypothetical protein
MPATKALPIGKSTAFSVAMPLQKMQYHPNSVIAHPRLQ